MHGIFWVLYARNILVLMVGVAGWLTGQMMGQGGYAEIFGDHVGGLDMIFGFVGASVGSYLFLLRSSAP
jgi:uncharacterized membrane protein YeaQ/YmgE (transglycosylase-associated protein family)